MFSTCRIYLWVFAQKLLILGDVEFCRRAGSLWGVDPLQHFTHNGPAQFYCHYLFQLLLLGTHNINTNFKTYNSNPGTVAKQKHLTGEKRQTIPHKKKH